MFPVSMEVKPPNVQYDMHTKFQNTVSKISTKQISEQYLMRGIVTAAAAHPRHVFPRCQRCGLFINRAYRGKLRTYRPRTAVPRLTAEARSAAATKTNEEMQPPRRPMVVKCAYVAFCACFGTLARLYTDEIRPSNVALQGSFLSNSIGSFALGVLEASDLNEEHLGGLYTGLTVGLCGSYTTFSGWNLRIGRVALGDAQDPTGGIVAAVSMVQTLAFFAACYVAGRDLVKTLAENGRGRWRAGGSGGRATTAWGALAGVATGYVILAILLYADDDRTRRMYWVACMFAPFGALLRFFLALQLNQRLRNGAFPAGTYLANVLGSLALALASYGATGSDLSGWSGIVLKGFQGGFLGSFTTMSTLMKEAVGNRESHGAAWSYLYLAATVATALVLVLVVGTVLG